MERLPISNVCFDRLIPHSRFPRIVQTNLVGCSSRVFFELVDVQRVSFREMKKGSTKGCFVVSWLCFLLVSGFSSFSSFFKYVWAATLFGFPVPPVVHEALPSQMRVGSRSCGRRRREISCRGAAPLEGASFQHKGPACFVQILHI